MISSPFYEVPFRGMKANEEDITGVGGICLKDFVFANAVKQSRKILDRRAPSSYPFGA